MQNPSSIALVQTAMRQELPNNLVRPQRKAIGFCTPEEDFRRTMHNVNHTGATTSMFNERKPSMQNPKNTERQTISHREPPTVLSY